MPPWSHSELIMLFDKFHFDGVQKNANIHMMLTFNELQVEGSTARAEEEEDDSFSSFMVWKGEECKQC